MPNSSRRRDFLLARRAAGLVASRAAPDAARSSQPPSMRLPPTPRPPAQHGDPRRRANPANFLLPASIQWFSDLPVDLRPTTLAAQYPRIVNVLAQSWSSPPACRARFEDLLSDKRGGRRGFPQGIQRELARLRVHYQTTFLSLDH